MFDDLFAEEEKLFSNGGDGGDGEDGGYIDDGDIDEKNDDTQYMKSEINARERTGHGGKLAELLSSTILGDRKKGKRDIISPEDRFRINTDALCRRMNSNNIYSLSEEDINVILQKTTDINELKYKNYVAYILGYIASRGDKSLDTKNFNHVVRKILPALENEGGVQPPDVLRYARFWHDFL